MSAADLKEKVNKLVKKSKDGEEGFTYTFLPTKFACVGRKGIVEHIRDTQPDVYSELKSAAGVESDKDFQSQLSKLIMNVPVCDNDKTKKVTNNTNKNESSLKENGKESGNRHALSGRVDWANMKVLQINGVDQPSRRPGVVGETTAEEV